MKFRMEAEAGAGDGVATGRKLLQHPIRKLAAAVMRAAICEDRGLVKLLQVAIAGEKEQTASSEQRTVLENG